MQRLAFLLLSPTFRANLYPLKRLLDEDQLRSALGATCPTLRGTVEKGKGGFPTEDSGQALESLQEILAQLGAGDRASTNTLLSRWQAGLPDAIEESQRRMLEDAAG
jgi:hypothetical protein